jgi:conjugative transfer signal peptidase TraF
MRRWFLISGLAIAGALAYCAALGLRWNTSPSLDPGLYRESPRAFKRGDLVVVCLPESVGRWAMGRGYVGGGGCPGGSAPLGKRIAATAGGRIEIRDREIKVDGRSLKLSGRVDRDTQGRPVPRVREGTYLLAPGEVWLHSGRHPRSLDSRVYGPLDASCVQAVIEPVWVHGGG